MKESEVREQIAKEIESQKMPVTAPSGSNDRAWQLGHNKGLADAAATVRRG